MLLPTPEYENLVSTLAEAKSQGKVVVLASGMFDLFHEEHKNYLEKSKAAGDLLVVAVESDARARVLKGDGRPAQNQAQRLESVLSVPAVDFAFVLPDEFNSPEKYEQLVAELRPSLYACSSHSPHLENKQALIEKYSGKLVIVHEHNPAVSTTQLVEQSANIASQAPTQTPAQTPGIVQ